MDADNSSNALVKPIETPHSPIVRQYQIDRNLFSDLEFKLLSTIPPMEGEPDNAYIYFLQFFLPLIRESWRSIGLAYSNYLSYQSGGKLDVAFNITVPEEWKHWYTTYDWELRASAFDVRLKQAIQNSLSTAIIEYKQKLQTLVQDAQTQLGLEFTRWIDSRNTFDKDGNLPKVLQLKELETLAYLTKNLGPAAFNLPEEVLDARAKIDTATIRERRYADLKVIMDDAQVIEGYWEYDISEGGDD